MEISMREAKARFAEVVAAAGRGERVVITKHSRPFIELITAKTPGGKTPGGMDFGKAAVVRRELGIDGLDVELPDDFDDPAYSRNVLGLPD